MAKVQKVIEVEQCPVRGCDNAGDEMLAPHFCRKHSDEFYLSAEGERHRAVREEMQRAFIERVNGCAECGSERRYPDGSCFGCGPNEAPMQAAVEGPVA